MKTTFTFFTNCNQCKIVGTSIACLLITLNGMAQKYYPAGLGNANLKLWLTAADPTTILTTAGTQAASGNNVAKWKDKSGMGADAVQATAASQPVYTAGVRNGLGALVFQNTSQYFTGVSGTYQTIVSARAITGTTGGTNYHYLFSAPANSDFSVRNSGGGPGANAVSYTDGPNVNDWCYNTSSNTQWVNGTQGLTGSNTNHILVDAAVSPVTATYSVSSTFMSRGLFGNDPVYELLAYNTTLSATQRRLLENYEAAEWGMTTYLPSSGYTIFTPPTASTYNKNLVGIGYTSSTDNFLTNPAGSTDGMGFSSTSTATGFLNTAGFLMAAHNGQVNSVIANASITGITGSNISKWNRSWNLQKTAGNSSGQVTINFNFNDYNGTTPLATSSYAILYNATDGSFLTGTNKLVNIVSAGTVSGNNVSFLVNVANLANGYYTLVYSATSILPVNFTAFTASLENGKTQLKWSVAEEAGNDVFLVQRSTDGINFSSIGTFSGSPVNISTASYSFNDEKPLTGQNYYRIQLTEVTGRTIYSAVKLINVTSNNNQATVAVYPNPAINIIQVNTNNANTTKGVVQLLNAAGQAVTVNISIPSSGMVQIPVAHLEAGIYYLQTTINWATTVSKVIKN